MKFRLVSLLWVSALFASALATFGAGGIVASSLVAALWGYVYFKPHNISWSSGILVAFTLVILLALLMPATQSARNIALRNSCANNLKQLVLSNLNYESANGHLPLARSTINNAAGHSWRAVILPYLEHNNLYSKIDFQQPWDSPKNKSLLNGPAWEVYQCPANVFFSTSQTSYFAIVDPRTVWPPDKPCTLPEVTDGISNTILLIEDHSRIVQWPEPKDLSFAEAVKLLTTPPEANAAMGHQVYNGFFSKPSYGINVAFVDGHVSFIPLPLPRDIATALLTKAGGEPITDADLRSTLTPDLDYGRIYTFCAFVVISLLPVLRLKGRRMGDAGVASDVDANPSDASHRG